MDSLNYRRSKDFNTLVKPYSIILLILISNINLYSQTDLDWAVSFGGESSEIGKSIALDADNNVYTCGCFRAGIDADPGIGYYSLNSDGSNDIYIQIIKRLDCILRPLF